MPEQINILQYTPAEIEAKLITTNSASSHEDFVAIAISVDDDGFASHSGIIIRYNDEAYFFHYDKKDVLLKKVDLDFADRVFHKELEIIDKSLILAFLIHCRVIQKTATPTYGYFYGGSFFDDGIYHSNNKTPQLMTCVGFCLNVLTGFLEEKKYLEFLDWQPVTEKAEDWFLEFVNKFIKDFPDVNVDELRKDFRRIKPSDLLSSAYFTSVPIRKFQTDSVKSILEQRISSLIAS